MLHELADQPPWMTRALCPETGPEPFYAEDREGVRTALAVCAGCPVRDDCLDFALDNSEIYGVWGGTSENLRTRLRARLRRELGLETRAPLPAGCGPRARQLLMVGAA